MLSVLKLPNFKQILILAILIRILIMPFYFHPDIKTTFFKTSFLGQGVLDIYSYLDKNISKLTIKENFNYFPLTYFLLGGYQVLTSPLLGSNFNDWLKDASQNAPERVEVFKYLFILKLPYLIFDILTALLLVNFFDNLERKKKAFALWLLNPFSIILIYIFSNIDIIPVFLTVASLLFAKKGNFILSGLMLGLGAGFKAYPLIFLPFLLMEARNYKERIKITTAALLSFIAIIAPFIGSSSFKDAALVSGLTTRIVFPGLNIGFGETLMVPVIAIAALIFFGMINVEEKGSLWKYYLSLLLLIFSFIHFHIQWLLWAIPFFVILLVIEKKLNFFILILAIFAFSVPLLYEDRSMTVALLSSINPLFNLLPTPFSIASRVYEPYTLQSVLHNFFAGGSLVLIWQMFKKI